MRSLKKLIGATTVASGLLLGAVAPSSAAVDGTVPVLQTKVCTSALVSLAKAQQKSLAPSKTITKALMKCSDSSAELPKPQFAAVSYKGRVVGAVFAVTEVNGKTTLFYESGGPEKSTVSRLLNGNGSAKKWGANNAAVVVTFAGGSHNGRMQASLGEGGSSVTITLDENFGVINPEKVVPVPASGSKINVYGDFFGYARTVAGPVYEKKWATAEGMKFGIAVDEQGNVIGATRLFGTGYSSETEWKFWKNRSYLIPLQTIVDQSQGIFE